jgi:hypothetical protein
MYILFLLYNAYCFLKNFSNSVTLPLIGVIVKFAELWVLPRGSPTWGNPIWGNPIVVVMV